MPPLRPLSRTALAVALVLTLAAGAARAQGPVGDRDISVETDPTIPVVGRPFSAVVRFATLRPQSVTVFYRTVGTVPYQSLAAQATGEPGVFRVALPGSVPESGIDVYAQYVVDGSTRTEPVVTPAQRPFRVPSLIPIARSALVLPARQYRMVTVPLFLSSQVPAGTTIEDLGSDEPDDVFGDDFGPGADPSLWRLLSFDPALNRAVDYAASPLAVGPVRPGKGFWLITAQGGGFDVEAGLSTGVQFEGSRPFPTPLTVEVGPGWNQIGNPFLFDMAWSAVEAPATVEDPVAYRGSYEPAQTILRPWEGYFVFNRGASTTLTFNAVPIPTSARARPPAERLLERSGRGGYVLDVRAEAGQSTDHVYLGLSEAAERLDLHKPPAIDGGLRLTVRDGDRALASSFRVSGESSWTLEVQTGDARGALSLVLVEHGSRPSGAALQVDDLDRGVALVVAGARIEVPRLSGTPVRRLRVRLGDASTTGTAVSVGRPYPVPATSGVTVPYTLGAAGDVRLVVYDVLGRTVRVLHDGPLAAGVGAATWDGRDARGRPVASGTYLVRLVAPAATATARVAVLH